jgi:hypothetical protein
VQHGAAACEQEHEEHMSKRTGSVDCCNTAVLCEGAGSAVDAFRAAAH